jgi:hypothetical protein
VAGPEKLMEGKPMRDLNTNGLTLDRFRNIMAIGEHPELLADQFPRPVCNRSFVPIFAAWLAVLVGRRRGLHRPLHILAELREDPRAIERRFLGSPFRYRFLKLKHALASSHLSANG